MAMERIPKQLRADQGHGFTARPATQRKARPGGRERVQRCLEILRLLAAGQEWPAKRLSEVFDVTHRTIQRDMELLENAGLVLRTNRQRPFRYRLAKEATLEQPRWSVAEVVTLLSLAGRMSDGASDSERAAAFAAVAKLVRLQPAAAREPLDDVVTLVAAQQPHLQARLCGLPWLAQLIEALVDHRALKVWTRDNRGRLAAPFVLVPSKIGVHSGQWFVSAYKVRGAELVTLELAASGAWSLMCRTSDTRGVIGS
jgi:predicted DNA-binding transcriptional regulator YafY